MALILGMQTVLMSYLSALSIRTILFILGLVLVMMRMLELQDVQEPLRYFLGAMEVSVVLQILRQKSRAF
jgi:hypothetical protein